jgi:hypothetical protein
MYTERKSGNMTQNSSGNNVLKFTEKDFAGS